MSLHVHRIDITVLSRHLYLKIILAISVGLIIFALLTSLLWNALGHEQFNRQIFARSSALAGLLLPADGTNLQAHQRAVRTISQQLEIDITVYDANRKLLAASDSVTDYPPFTPDVGDWRSVDGESLWVSRLADDRVVIVNLDRSPVPSEGVGIALSLVFLAVMISLFMYPFIRNLTGRLERLKSGVEQIGSGNLGTRVKVEGKDEVAVLASSFNQAADRIETLMGSQRLLLANASHELRTPLSRIRLGVEMLRQDTDSAQAATLEQDIRELDALIDEIILMTRLDTADSQQVWESVDLTATAAEECARYPECTFTGTAVEIIADPRMLQHLVRNLIDNAYKHGAEPVAVSVTRTDTHAEFTVSDAGSGIAESDREKVFEPFYRARNKQNIPGYGLGLALARKIVVAHHGTIVIGPEGSSCISAIFPLQPE